MRLGGRGSFGGCDKRILNFGIPRQFELVSNEKFWKMVMSLCLRDENLEKESCGGKKS